MFFLMWDLTNNFWGPTVAKVYAKCRESKISNLRMYFRDFYGCLGLLGQWLNFKLFGITYLVGKIQFKLFFSGSIGCVSRELYIYIYIILCTPCFSKQYFDRKDGMLLKHIGHVFVRWRGIQTLRALECYNITGTSAITLKSWKKTMHKRETGC